jgi:CMP-N-acetylneuraminic acid synthetase
VIPKITAMMPMKAHSERVPGKNIRPLAGRPLYHWMMDALRGSKYIDEILVNTDSETIGREAERLFGARYIPRPAHLLGDHVSMTPLIEYDLSQCDATVMLQTHSTNPLITTATVDRVIERYFSPGDHDSVFTVNTFHSRFYWDDGRPVNHDLNVMLRTQDLPPLYEENSCLYVFSRDSFAKAGRRVGISPVLEPTDPLESVDIDEEHQFKVADILMRERLAASG